MPARFVSFLCLATFALGAVLFAAGAHAATINGRVFEDVNYGGGAGRTLAAANGVGINGVRVELYSDTGAFLAATTTATSNGNAGSYSFTYSGHLARTVRVVNGTVRSSRTGGSGCTTCVAVQTFRTAGSGNSANSVANRVGGENPTLNDAPSNTTNASLNSLTTSTQTPQSVALFDPSGNNSTINNANFGFNFSTIVNTRDAAACTPTAASYFPCQGTLRQFLINSEALANPSAQAGLPAGYETSIFMIPLTNGGVANITLASALPALTAASTRLDATTQTANIGNTNSGTVGSIGSVGVDGAVLSGFQRPEVQISAGNTTLTLAGPNQTLAGFALAQGYIDVSAGASSAIVSGNLVGFTATGASSSGAATHGITFAGPVARITGNYVAVDNSGIRGDNPATGTIIEYNEVTRPSAGHSNTFDGILIIGGASSITVRNNLIREQSGAGIEIGFGAGSMSTVLIENNTVRNNGFSSGAMPSSEPVGIAAYGYSGSATIRRNRIENNAGPGVLVMAANATITENRFSANGGLAIDLDPNTRDPNSLGTPDGLTLNDNGDGDSGANGLLNFPVITAATLVNGEFSVAGFARPGSAIELYVAQPDPTGFGEGLTYLGTFTEGIGDLDATTGTYSGSINGRNQGTDTTNRFLFRGNVPGGVSAGTVLTSTATLGGETSEFGGNVTVTGGPTLVHSKSVRVESDPFNNTSNPKSIPGSIQVYTIRITNQASGTVDNNSIEIVDSISANTVMCGLGSNVVTFQNGTPSSGLTFNAASNVAYSSTAGTPPVWGYTPAPDANGCDATIRHIRIRPQGTMAGSGGSGNPYFEVTFRVKVL